MKRKTRCYMKYSVYYPVFSTATFHVTVSPLFLLNYCTVCDRKFDFLSSSFSSKICCLAAESFTFSGASREKRDQKPRLTSSSGFTEKQLCAVLHDLDVLVKCFLLAGLMTGLLRELFK